MSTGKPPHGARLVPPPEDAKASVGESRSAQRAAVALNFGEVPAENVGFLVGYSGVYYGWFSDTDSWKRVYYGFIIYGQKIVEL